MSEAGVASVMLAVKFSRSVRINATAVWGASSKLEFEGSPRVPENRPRRVQQQRPPEGVESIGQESPVGDHQANGDVESAVRTRKAQMRATRFGLESRLGRQLAHDDPILMWIPTFAGDTTARFRKGPHGKMP